MASPGALASQIRCSTWGGRVPFLQISREPPERVEAIAALRRLRMTGPEIAEALEMATSTVLAVLKRIGLGKLSRLGSA